VLLGLQSNAFKFTQNGKIQTDVRIVKIIQTDMSIKKLVEISVIDTGIGIEYEDQDKLFKLFGFV